MKLKHETLFRKAYATPSCDVVAICMEMAQCPLRGFTWLNKIIHFCDVERYVSIISSTGVNILDEFYIKIKYLFNLKYIVGNKTMFQILYSLSLKICFRRLKSFLFEGGHFWDHVFKTQDFLNALISQEDAKLFRSSFEWHFENYYRINHKRFFFYKC